MHSEPPIGWTARDKLIDGIPGLAVVAIITAFAFSMDGVVGLSPMIIAIVSGILVNSFLGPQPALAGGIAIAGKKLLRVAVALLGLQLTLDDISEIGSGGLFIAAAAVLLTYLFTLVLGRLLRVDSRLAHLIAAGTSICGASAIAASNAVVRGRDEDVSYAIASITIFGTLAMLILPFLNEWLELAPRLYGIWVGASVHEVAQVVGAAFEGGPEAGHFGVVTKLTRVLMLAPLVIVVGSLSFSVGRLRPAGRRHVPDFVIAFVLLAVANTFDLVPDMVGSPLIAVTPLLLTAALGALGLGTSFQKLRAEGMRPLLLAFAATAFISLSVLIMVQLIL